MRAAFALKKRKARQPKGSRAFCFHRLLLWFFARLVRAFSFLGFVMIRKLDMIRMLDWLAVSVLLALAIWYVAPHQLPVSLYKLSLITTAAVVGYWIDRSLFPYGRPDKFGRWRDELFVNSTQATVFAACMLRRAIIIAACVIGVALGA